MGEERRHGIGRRAALGAIGGGVAGLSFATPSAAKPGPAHRLPLDTPAERLRAFMLMRGALDDRVVIGYLDGRYHGCVNGEMKPMFGVVSATFSRFRPLADGAMESVSVEQAYFLDLDTGERITRYANPYTGRTVDVPTGGYAPTRTIFTPDLEMRIADPQPGMALRHSASPFMVAGDDVWLTEVTTVTMDTPAGAAPFLFHETVGLHARLSEMTTPGVKRVRCETSYTSVKSWRKWLQMDGHPGETVSSGAGLYGASAEALPASWLAAARVHRPQLIDNPAMVLDPVWHRG